MPEKETLSPELKQELQKRAIDRIRNDLYAKAATRKVSRAGSGDGVRLLEQLEVEARERRKLEKREADLREGLPEFDVFGLPTGPVGPPVIWVYAAPYEFEAQNSQCNGDPDQCVALANGGGGSMTLALHIVNGGADIWGFAGVGAWFVPRTPAPVLIEFSTLLYWSYGYELVAGPVGQTAHSSGEVGLRIFSWDANGQDEQEETLYKPLWAYGVDFWDDAHADGGSGNENLYLSFGYEPGRHYAGVSYIFAACDAGGWPVSSQATVDMFGNQPLLVTKEYPAA